MTVSEPIPLKAVLVGDSGVGKTSLITRWVKGEYIPITSLTVGANSQRKRVSLANQDVDLHVWDTAGQERFQSLTPVFARSSVVAILVVSVQDPSTFTSVDRWLGMLNSSTDRMPPVVLAVNKMDLASPDLSREEIVDKFSPKCTAVFFASAVTNEGVDSVFQCAADSGYQFHVTQTGQAVTTSIETGDNSSACC
jgi:small GTP-binding protein